MNFITSIEEIGIKKGKTLSKDLSLEKIDSLTDIAI
jgi:hypothetical protein